MLESLIIPIKTVLIRFMFFSLNVQEKQIVLLFKPLPTRQVIKTLQYQGFIVDLVFLSRKKVKDWHGGNWQYSEKHRLWPVFQFIVVLF